MEERKCRVFHRRALSIRGGIELQAKLYMNFKEFAERFSFFPLCGGEYANLS